MKHIINRKSIQGSNQKDKDDLFLLLDKYYIKNIFYDFFALMLYFLMGFLIFMLYRIILFNIEICMEFFDNMNLTYVIILKLLTFLFIMHYYMKILHRLFGDYPIKIHFYLMQYTWYENINSLESDRYQWISNKFSDMWEYVAGKTVSKEQFIKLFYISSENEHKDVFTSKEYLSWEKIQQNPYLLYFYRISAIMLNILSRWSSLFLYYFLHSSVVLVLCYDIHQGKLYYLYYMLAIYFLLKFIRKIRNFIQVKDPVYDDIIMRYFYKNDVSYEEIRITLESPSRKSSDMGNTISFHEKEIKRYFDNNYHADNIADPHMTRNRKRNYNFARRLNIIFLLILGAMYNSFHHGKYFFAFSNYNIALNYLLISVIIILFYANYKIFYRGETRKKALEYKPYLWVFRIIVIFVILPVLYFILKNKLTVMSNETLFDIKDNIRFYEVFTLEDKYNYFRRYLNYLERSHSLKKERIGKLIEDMTAMVNIDTSLSNVRTQLDQIVDLWINADAKSKKVPLWELIINHLDKIKKLFFK